MRKIIAFVCILMFITACVPNPSSSTQMTNRHGNQIRDAPLPTITEYSASVESLPNIIPHTDIKDAKKITLEANIVTQEFKGKQLRRFAYNNQIPGPTIWANKEDIVEVNFKNNLDVATTVHWHGLRHDFKDDGTPDISQKEVAPGESFTYHVRFPDAGVYWYHPHVREDHQQEMGLYGMMVVRDAGANPVDKEEVLVLDDILLTADGLAPFFNGMTNYAMMGRYGNQLLVNNEESYRLTVKKGEVVRFYLANVANARPFKVSFTNTKMKLVGGDLGRYEKETWVDEVLIGPAERYIVEVQFTKDTQLMHTTPYAADVLGAITVQDEQEQPKDFATLRTYDDIISDIDAFRVDFDKKIDHSLELTMEMHGMGHRMGGMGASADGIEWEVMMPMNARMTAEDVTWKLRDTKTGKENYDLEYVWKKGQRVKMKITNSEDSMHPMQHPVHFHGQRFLVLTLNGKKNTNLVWKDTVLIPAGDTVELLLDVTNVGEWMAHCHIAEHLEADMATVYTVIE